MERSVIRRQPRCVSQTFAWRSWQLPKLAPPEAYLRLCRPPVSVSFVLGKASATRYDHSDLAIEKTQLP